MVLFAQFFLLLSFSAKADGPTCDASEASAPTEMISQVAAAMLLSEADGCALRVGESRPVEGYGDFDQSYFYELNRLPDSNGRSQYRADIKVHFQPYTRVYCFFLYLAFV